MAASFCGCWNGSSETPTVSEENPKEPAEVFQDGHQRMLAELRQINEQRDSTNNYLGEGRFEDAKRKLETVMIAGSLPAKVQAHSFAGQRALELGKNEEAIKYIETAYELFQQADPIEGLQMPFGVEEQLRYSLAVACMRKGEIENCVHCRTGESCILPIGGAGVHTKPSGSQGAIKYLTLLLEQNPDHLPSIWLLNIANMTVGTYPEGVPEEFRIPRSEFESRESFPRFENISARMKLDTLSLSGGAIADDFDGDHLLDLVVSEWETTGQLLFFRNNGDGTFSDRTAAANLTGFLGGLNLVQADYDNDGDVDFLVLRGAWLTDQGRHPNSLLRNDGDARFTDVTFEAGLGDEHFPTQTAAWADFDNDGDLDLYVGNEEYPSQLFENDGQGRFRDVADQAGVTNDRLPKGVTWGDYDGDRFPDLFVSNYRGKNRLYHNNGNGTFTDVAPQLGMEKPRQSFPTWFWDYNNDGALDLYVPTYQESIVNVAADYLGREHRGERDCLYEGDGRGGFREVAQDRKILRVSQPMGSNFGDLDNDGFLDFYLGTGYTDFDALMPNLMYRNRGGREFSDVTFAGGFGHLQKGHGVAFADFDHDGDQDIFIEMGGAYVGDAFQNALFENPGFGNQWIKIRLVGQQSNRSAIGARIKIVVNDAGTTRAIYRWVGSGSSFGANPLRQEVGLGKAQRIETLEVYWPTTDQTQQFEDLEVNQFVEIVEASDAFRKIPLQSASFPPAEVHETE
jgi:tetratricopeptide (TPR) repeat protein